MAQYVIVTVSIGVLQNELIQFTPSLPDATVNAYQGIGIDQGMKVLLRFSTAWWKFEDRQLGWLVTEGVCGAAWAPSDYKEGSSDHIIMCYPMGHNGDLLTALGSDAAIIDAVLSDLDKVFPHAPNQATANFLDGLVQNWGADPYTRGVYSYPMVGTVTDNVNLREQLQNPIANGRVYFAGEGTHITHPATVPGALHEGERVALHIAAMPELQGEDVTSQHPMTTKSTQGTHNDATGTAKNSSMNEITTMNAATFATTISTALRVAPTMAVVVGASFLVSLSTN